MPSDRWAKRLADNREVEYSYEEEDGLFVASARVIGTPVIYIHKGIQTTMTRVQVEAEFEHDLRRR